MLGKDNKFLHPHVVNIIQHGTTINGDIECDGDLRLDGTIKGNVKISGRLVMGHDAHIEGIVECTNAEISGKIKGNIKVKETLQLKKQCNIDGDVYTKKLIVEEGSIFNGKCVMNLNNDELFNFSTNEKNKKQLVKV